MLTSPTWRTLLILVIALFPRLLIVVQPIPVQLDKTLPDDAYYYFLTAQNIAAGNGPSVDGMHDSNGWHPLWMLITTGIFASDYADPDVPVRIALALGALLDSLVAVVLYRVGRKYAGEAAFVGALVYALNAMPIFQSVNGLETGLAALMIALAWVATLWFLEAPTARRAAGWGAVFGLSFLARTDTALILAWLGLYALVALWRRERRSLPLLAVGAVTAVVVIVPWLLWNQANFGSALAQTSSTAVPWAAATRFRAANPDTPLWQLSLNVLTYPQYWLRGDYFGTPVLVGFLLWPAAAFGLWRARENQPRLVTVTLMLLAGGVSLVLVHTLLRYYPRPWYFVVTAQSLSLGLMLFWRHAGKTLRLVSAAVGLPLLLISGWMAWQVGYYPWQQQLQYAAALWVRENAKPDDTIASMNSGIIGYYGGHPTVNLDGVVNPDAFEAIQNDRLLDFMREAGVDIFVDVDYALEGEYGVFMGEDYPEGLREIEPVGEAYPGLGQIRAYAVE